MGCFRIPNAAFINPTFLKSCNRKTDGPLTHYDANANMFFVDRFERSAGAFYSDALIGNVSRLRAKSRQFLEREIANEIQARKYFSQLPFLKNPFMAFLPNVSAYRRKIRTWAMRKAEARTNSGFYPVHYLSGKELEKLLSWTATALPYAENFFDTARRRLANSLDLLSTAKSKWLKQINSLELRLTKLFRGGCAVQAQLTQE